MYILVRKISPYTHADVLLGVFYARSATEKASLNYVAHYTAQPAADPWQKQGYKEATVLEHDLEIQELASTVYEAGEVFVVSNYLDGFGQVFRQFDSIHGSEVSAKARVKELDSREDDFPHYAMWQRCAVDVLLSDARQEQPQLL